LALSCVSRPLDSEEIEKALTDREHPHEIQHALSQIADRMLSTDESVRTSARQFYPGVVLMSQEGGPELRLIAASIMGQDNTVPDFHTNLWVMTMHDTSPMVRRRAALALVRFGDFSGLNEIRAILAPYSMGSPISGRFSAHLRPGDPVNYGTVLGHVTGFPNILDFFPGEQIKEVAYPLRADVAGQIHRWLVTDGDHVKRGEPLILIDSTPVEVFDALRTLYLMGEPRDLPALEQFLHGAAVPENIRQQAKVTAEAIRSRPLR
jgi:hypothetical protein